MEMDLELERNNVMMEIMKMVMVVRLSVLWN